jgi:hypothetical protein
MPELKLGKELTDDPDFCWAKRGISQTSGVLALSLSLLS